MESELDIETGKLGSSLNHVSPDGMSTRIYILNCLQQVLANLPLEAVSTLPTRAKLARATTPRMHGTISTSTPVTKTLGPIRLPIVFGPEQKVRDLRLL